MISAIIKGFFSSIWSALRRWRMDRETERLARLLVEREENKQAAEVRKLKKEVEDGLAKIRDLDDVLDDL